MYLQPCFGTRYHTYLFVSCCAYWEMLKAEASQIRDAEVGHYVEYRGCEMHNYLSDDILQGCQG